MAGKVFQGRTKHVRAILGDDAAERLAKTKVLLVGAGGIGCELCACFSVAFFCARLERGN